MIRRHPLAPDVPIAKPRRKPKWRLRTTPPRCDHCRKWLHPDIDHTACKETS